MTLDAAGIVTSLRNVGLSLLDNIVEFTEFRVSPNFLQCATLLGASEGIVYRSSDGDLTSVVAGHPGGS